MSNVAPSSLANLRSVTHPPFQAGQPAAASRSHSRGYNRVLRASRKASHRAILTAIKCMDAPDAPWPARLKAAELILDRAWGAPDAARQISAESHSPALLKIVVVQPSDPQLEAPVVTVEAAPAAEDSGADNE